MRRGTNTPNCTTHQSATIGGGIEQVTNRFTINFNELHLDLKLCANNSVAQLLHLVEHGGDHAWNDANVFLTGAGQTAGAHGVRLARARLAICQHSCVVALETGVNQGADNLLVHRLWQGSNGTALQSGKPTENSPRFRWRTSCELSIGNTASKVNGLSSPMITWRLPS